MAITLQYGIVILLAQISCCGSALHISGYYTWSTQLFCPDRCRIGEVPDQCCSCHAKPCWELDPGNCLLGKVHMEYIDIFGNGIVLGLDHATRVELVSTRGMLRQLPENICNWDKQLVKLDLRHNRLNDVKRLKCAMNLDTIHLDFNVIQHIDNTTFTLMKHLRILTVSHNMIVALDPNVINIGERNILTVDFSYNHRMEYLDITNVFRPGEFCSLNFNHSAVEHITNEIGFTMDKILHGPGDINLENTHIGSFFNLTSIGIEDIKEIGKYFAGEIRIDASSIDCDCTLYPLFESLGSGFANYWPNLNNQVFECNSPEHMKGKNLTTMLQSNEFSNLTCDITETPECPHYLCHCIDEPGEHKVLVNCTGVGFTSLPDVMPIGAWNNFQIDLILADNKITELVHRNYLTRLVHLDLRKNNIRTFTPEAALGISSRVNIEDQILTGLPPRLQQKDPKLFTFGRHPVVCDCSNIWIGDWIRLKDGHGRLNCSVNGEIVPAENVTDASLNCKPYTMLSSAAIITPLVGGITIVVLVSGLCYIYRYEIIIVKRSLFRKAVIGKGNSIDVFLSFYEDNEYVFSMVREYLKPALVEAGYSVFIPWFDIQYGEDRDIELAVRIGRSVNYVIILSDDYANNYQTVSELETLWKHFTINKSKQIILINFDNINVNSITDERLRALRRMWCLDFSTRNTKLITRLLGKLGKPLKQQKADSIEVTPDDDNGRDKGNDAIYFEMEEMNNSSKENTLDQNKLAVFERLTMPRISECNNGKYRKCNLHDNAFDHRQRNQISQIEANRIVPL